jgi:ABC-type multidrug transport system fused ATPase/permease subunit
MTGVEGQVAIDGMFLTNATAETLRRRIAWIGQEPYVRHDADLAGRMDRIVTLCEGSVEEIAS